MRFGVRMVWREPKNHHEDCYFCVVDMTGWNQRKKKDWYYPDIESARQPVPHCTEVPVPVFTFLPDLMADEALLEAMEDSSSVVRGGGGGGGYSPPPIGMSTKMQNGKKHHVFSTFETVFCTGVD